MTLMIVRKPEVRMSVFRSYERKSRIRDPAFIMNRRERAYQFLMSITRYLSSLPGLLSGLSNTALFSASLRFM